MKVKATLQCYYGDKLRQPGEVFELVERKGFSINQKTQKKEPLHLSAADQFSHECMERLDGPAPEPKAEPKEEPKADVPKPKPAPKKKAEA